MSEYILKPCPFCGSEPMLGEVRPATRKQVATSVRHHLHPLRC